MQAQNVVNMASGTATTAPCAATTAPSTATLPLTAGPSTMESIIPIVTQLQAQDTPSVIQRARPAVSAEQIMQSTLGYGTLPYLSGPPYTAPLPSMAPLLYAAYTAPLPSTHPCHMLPCLYVSKAYFTNGLLWSGQSVPFCA